MWIIDTLDTERNGFFPNMLLMVQNFIYCAKGKT